MGRTRGQSRGESRQNRKISWKSWDIVRFSNKLENREIGEQVSEKFLQNFRNVLPILNPDLENPIDALAFSLHPENAQAFDFLPY